MKEDQIINLLFNESDLRLTYDCILVEEVPRETVTSSGILLPDRTTLLDSAFTRGRVIKVGPGKLSPSGNKLVPLPISVGEDVIFQKYHEDWSEREGNRTRMVVKAKYVTAVLNPEVSFSG